MTTNNINNSIDTIDNDPSICDTCEITFDSFWDAGTHRLENRGEHRIRLISDPAPLKVGNVVVGQRVTVCHHSDAHVAEVVKVSASGKQFTLREMTQTLNKEKSNLTFTPGGFMAHVSGEQVYDIKADEDGYTTVARWSNKRSRFVTQGWTVIAGEHPHYDYNF